ncbi:mannonate dehydratase [Paludibaculum fermentans]|uniref:mannonate dehydratase n=1 Tax=Paludibaculum fermentans TaxID=1473598 RepID=UPI003EBEF173
MPRITRRTYVKAPLAALALGAAEAAPAGRTTGQGGIQFSEILNPGEASRMRLAKQIGINHAIVNVNSTLAKVPRTEYVQALTKIREEFTAAGLKIAGVESHPVPAEKIKLGLPGRDEEIENYQAAIAALAQVGVPMICYNFMAGLGWYRTRVDLKERGGALTSEFNNADAKKLGLTKFGEVTEALMWSNIEYFQKAVIPVAEKHNILMALHPDDPPLSPLRGLARIVISAKNYRRIMNIVPSPVNGITYCQANFVAMGEDVYSLAQEWLKEKKIFFVHFRDIEGKGERFRETFHDNGPTDMARMLKIYGEGGFNGPVRPDHAPTLEGEGNDRPGYAMGGKVFAIGYMRGILDAYKLPHS